MVPGWVHALWLHVLRADRLSLMATSFAATTTWLKAKGPGGLPRWALVGGAAVGAYLLYRWYSARSATAPGYDTGYEQGAASSSGQAAAPSDGGGGMGGFDTSALSDYSIPIDTSSLEGITIPLELPTTPVGTETTASTGGSRRRCPKGSHMSKAGRCAPDRGNRTPAQHRKGRERRRAAAR